MSYTRYPAPPPSRRGVWMLICVFLAVLVASLLHSTTGVG